MKFIKLTNAAQDGFMHVDPAFIGIISRNKDADTFIRFKDGSYAHVLEMPDEVVKMINPPSLNNTIKFDNNTGGQNAANAYPFNGDRQ